MKASEFREIVRKLVAEEVKRQLPRVLAESYLRKIVAETVQPVRSGPHVGSIVEALDPDIPEDTDGAPVAMRRSVYPIGSRPVTKRKPNAEVVQMLRERLGGDFNPYEGSSPIEDGHSTDVSEGMDPESMGISIAGPIPLPGAPRVVADDDRQMKMLELRRRALEVPAR